MLYTDCNIGKFNAIPGLYLHNAFSNKEGNAHLFKKKIVE